MKTVFVSSTFKDMHFERDAIQDITLPLINDEASKYSQRVSFCDLRWGVNTTDLDSDDGSKKVLDVCLDEIDRCKPLMVVVLGDRYGWIPDEKLITYAAEKKSVKLDDYQTSVTALEIEYGALLDEEKCCSTLFYFREIENDAPADYRAESVQHKEKLDALKSKILKLTKNRIKTYKVKWNGSSFDGMDAFASMLASDLIEMLKPQWEEYAQLTPFEREINTHKSFISEKSIMFRARKSIADEILANIKNNSLTVIKGVSGCGKSTLLSYVAQRLINNGESILPFICGLTSKSTDAMDILKSIVFYFEEKLGYKHFEKEKDPITGEIKHDVNQWRERLDELCASFSKNENRLIIIVDAVDQLLANELRDQLVFIPRNLDGNVKFVFSCLSDFNTTGMEHIQITSLNESDKRDVIQGTLSAMGRQLSDAVISEIMSMPASENPLYISLLIQRLTMMNRFDFDIINKGDKNNQMTEISKRQIEILKGCPLDLNKMCVAIVEESGKRINADLAKRVVEYISVSRHGLRPEDLEKLIGENWDTIDFAHFVAYLNDSFLLRDDGRYDFAHKSIRAGFSCVCEDQQKKHVELLEYLKSLPEEDPVRITEIIYHCIKADDKSFFIDYIEKYGQFYDLINIAAKDTYDCAIRDKGKWLCCLLAENLKFDEDYRITKFISGILNVFFCYTPDELNVQYKIIKANIEVAKKFVAKYGAEKKGLTKSSDFSQVMAVQFAYATSSIAMADSMCVLGDIYVAYGSRDKLLEANKLYKNSLKIRQQIQLGSKISDRFSSTWDNYISIAISYGMLGNKKRAVYYVKRGLRYSESITDEELKLEYFIVGCRLLCAFYLDMGGKKNIEKAQFVIEKALELIELNADDCKIDKYILDMSDELASIYVALGGKENLLKALKLYEKSLSISEQRAKERKAADSLSHLAESYNRIGDTYISIGGPENLETALELYEKSLKINEQLANEQRSVNFYHNLVRSYCNVAIHELTANEKKREYFLHVIEIAQMLYDKTKDKQFLRLADVSEDYLKKLLKHTTVGLISHDDADSLPPAKKGLFRFFNEKKKK